MVLVTAILTAAVGFVGWFAQSRVQHHVDEKSQELEARLAMTQQVYGRKLAIDEGVHQQVTGLVPGTLYDLDFATACLTLARTSWRSYSC
jgi:hypothetical protein